MNPARRYPFDLPWRGVAIGTAFYAGLSALVAYWARDYAGVFFVGLMTFSGLFGVLAVVLLTRRILFPRVLELAEDAIVFPHGFPRTRITRISYTDIIRMFESGVAGQQSLHLVTGTGSFAIMAARLPDMESYRAVRNFICAQTSVNLPPQEERKPTDWRIGGFPDPIVCWLEPEDWPRYRTWLNVSKPLWPRLAKSLWFFTRCLGLFLLPWLLLYLCGLPTAPLASYGALSVAVAFFFTSLGWLNTKYPVHKTQISFRDKGITQDFGKQYREWNYHAFSGWAIIERQFEGRVLHILLLKARTHVFPLAMPDTDIRDRVVQILNDKNIPQAPDLKPPWESRL